jgi:hypothetical protein
LGQKLVRINSWGGVPAGHARFLRCKTGKTVFFIRFAVAVEVSLVWKTFIFFLTKVFSLFIVGLVE